MLKRTWAAFCLVCGSATADPALPMGLSMESGVDRETQSLRFALPIRPYRTPPFRISADGASASFMLVRGHPKGSLNPLFWVLAAGVGMTLPERWNLLPFLPHMLTNFSLEPRLFPGVHGYLRQKTDVYPAGLTSESGVGVVAGLRGGLDFSAGASKRLLDSYDGGRGFGFQARVARWF